jgi:predicted metal-dependent peptidase
VNVLQWDAAFQGYEPYRRGDWKRIMCKGRGGTDMVGPMDWLIDNKLVPDCTILLTDGYTGWHQNINFPCITVITVPEGTVDGPPYGHTVRMTVS